MQISIKESDRYTFEDRVWLALKGLFVTVLGIFVTYATWVAGWVASPTLMVLIIGLAMMRQAFFEKYKNEIKILRVSQQGCPECGNGPIELYKEKIDSQYQRECFGRTRVTEKWAVKIHCLECGLSGSFSSNNNPVVAVPQVLPTKSESMDIISSKSTNPESDQENVPLATNVELI